MNEANAYKELVRQAKSGKADAQVQLALTLLLDSPERGIEWLKKAAAQGSAKATLYLAGSYYRGEGVEKDTVKAVNLLLRAAELGDPIAQNSLGTLYFNGTNVERDEENGIFWIQESARSGWAEAQCNLGCICRDRGDIFEAVYWIQQSAKQGLPRAQHILANFYYDGIEGESGLEQDRGMAVQWWQRAAEQGFSDSQYRLGMCYFTGNGVSQNLTEARRWLRTAAAQGNELALEMSNFIDGRSEAEKGTAQ